MASSPTASIEPGAPGTDAREAADGNLRDDEVAYVSVDEAISVAVLLHKEGHRGNAEALLRKILEFEPDHPAAMEFLGAFLHMRGQSSDGERMIRRSLELGGERPGALSNLGIVLKAQGRLEEASQVYRRALELAPQDANAHNNLGVLLKARGMRSEAEAEYRAAIAANPDHADAYQNLGLLLAGQRRLQEAADCYFKAVTLRPRNGEARRLLGLAYCHVGQPERAVDIFTKWLREEPDNPIAHHLLAACSGRATPNRASDSYIERTFDDFAASFDAKLEQLHYRAPQLVASVLAQVRPDAHRQDDAVDVGCGTGLCGSLVAPWARRLVGVDLSENMLARARETGVYDELVRSELTTYLSENASRFDIVVSADTLVYFGPLEDVLGAAAHAMRPGGVLVFTLEEAADGGAPHRLNFHGRYSHTRAYVASALAQAGLEPTIVPAELRLEAGRPVAGMVIVGAKPLGDAARSGGGLG